MADEDDDGDWRLILARAQASRDSHGLAIHVDAPRSLLARQRPTGQ